MDRVAGRGATEWVDAVRLPPDAVPAEVVPYGSGAAVPGMWCDPMAHDARSWFLPTSTTEQAQELLSGDPVSGLVVHAAAGPTTGDDDPNDGGYLVEVPRLAALEALVFTFTAEGAGARVQADAFRIGADSVCATAPPGETLAIG